MKLADSLMLFQVKKLYESNENMVNRKYRLHSIKETINRAVQDKNQIAFDTSLEDLTLLSKEIIIELEKTSVFHKDSMVEDMKKRHSELVGIMGNEKETPRNRDQATQDLIGEIFKNIDKQRETLVELLDKSRD